MPAENKIPFILVTGFLGSGKTTFVKRLLERYAGDKRIGVIQNEYASANIDTEELKSVGKKFDVLEINKGSVFCVCLLANFIDSLADFIEEYKTEMIILEASGLSDPIAVTELLQHEKLRGKIYLLHTWCIIDAQNYFKVSRMADRINRQVRIADTLIINKTEIRVELEFLNPYAVIYESTYCAVEIDKEFSGLSENTVAWRRREDHSGIEPLDRAAINTVVLKTTYSISEDQLYKFISEVENKLIRMKGYINLKAGKPRSIQSEFGNTQIQDAYRYTGPTELIGLGYDITSAEFGRRFHDIRKGG
jgi:G3E family GTPase